MNPKAIAKAQSRLRVARSALASLKDCHNFQEFSDHWYVFLTASKNVFTVIEQGAKSSPQSRQWFGMKKNERKTDELLQYIFQARNDDEHGLNDIAEKVFNSIDVSLKANQYYDTTIKIHIPKDAEDEWEITEVLDSAGTTIVSQVKPHIRLVSVTGRGNKKYNPPKIHKGEKIEDRSPYGVGVLTIDYLTNFLEEASKKV